MQSIKVQSPGRINIIGEHTDYNDGFVLPAAIDKKAIVQLQRNGTTSAVNLQATNLGERFSFDLTHFSPLESGWQNYVMGVVHELQQLGAPIQGFDGSIEGNVPLGSGMSSSAALECSLAYALNNLFELRLSKAQLIKAAQLAEHHFVGTKCGIMDQFASMMGKKNQVILLDCRSLEYEYFPLELGDYQLLLLNTNVSHSLASSAYNTRREECEEGVALLQKQLPEIINLRDVSLAQLKQYQAKLPETIFRRCHHVVTENQRVLDATQALKTGKIELLGNFMYQSHFSLQKEYEVSCPELDFLVQLGINNADVLGSRMMGGGFGGCTINVIKKESTTDFIEKASQGYRTAFGIDLSPYTVSIQNGTSVLS